MFRIIRYHYYTDKVAVDPFDDIEVNPTNLTTDNEIDAIEICDLLKKAYDLGNTRKHNEWFRFGFEDE
jgi:hypothetical protein